MANLGLIITNQKYKSEDLDDLPKVAEDAKRMKERGQSDTKTTKTPVGRCLVGTTGKLYSVHDLKRKLLECGSSKITITLDWCRTQHRGLQKRRSVKLKEKLPLPIA